MFWKKREQPKFIEDLLNLIKLAEVRLCTVEAQVEIINGKFRKKLYRGSDKADEGKDQDFSESDKGITDGFDDLRKLYKERR